MPPCTIADTLCTHDSEPSSSPPDLEQPDQSASSDMSIAAWSAMNGYLEILLKLIKEDPTQLHAKDDKGRTLVHYAAAGGQLEVMKWLKDTVGLDVKATDNCGRNAFHYVAARRLIA